MLIGKVCLGFVFYCVLIFKKNIFSIVGILLVLENCLTYATLKYEVQTFLTRLLWWNRFVNLMDGHIWIESEGLGKGSIVTFIVKLNVPEPPSQHSIQISATSQPSSSQSRTDFSGVRVLVTDDNG